VLVACVVLSLGSLWPSASAGRAQARGASHGPVRHIVFVAIDSMRTDRLFPPEGSRSPMPFTSALLRERGTGFANSYVPLARTFPSWVSILTSQYPQATGVQTMFPRASERLHVPPTLHKVLNDADFFSGVYSDFAGDIFRRYPFGFTVTRTPTLNFRTLIESAVLEASAHLLPYLRIRQMGQAFPASAGLAEAPDAERITRECLADLRAHSGQSTFSLLFYSDAHFPYAAPYPAYDEFRRPGYDGPNRFQFSASTMLGASTSATDVAQVRALYDAGLWSIDRQIEQLVSELRAAGVLEQTILVLSADHGENLGEHGMGFAHGNHLLGVVSHSVPFVWVDFSQPKPAQPIDFTRQVSSLHIAPTLLSLVNVKAPSSFAGKSLTETRGDLPVLLQTGIWFVDRERSKELHQSIRIPYPGVDRITEPNAANDDEIELSDHYAQTVYFAKHLGYQAGHERLVYMPLRPRPRWQLFDVMHDPWTQHDLAAEQPDRLAALRERMLGEMRAVAPLQTAGDFLFWGAAIPQSQKLPSDDGEASETLTESEQ
jgi:arylsulfatase A-like enzyme